MKTIPSALVLLAYALPLSGCSLIGFGIGAASDANASKEYTRLTPLEALSPGSSVTVVTTHGDTVSGEVVGMRRIEGYESIYRERVSETLLGVVVPEVQGEVTVVAHGKPQLFGAHQYRFQAKVLGFDPGIIRLSPENSRYGPVLPLSELDSLLRDGGYSIDAATLISMVEKHLVPFQREIGIRLPGETRWIPNDEIGLISDDSPHHGALTGFLIGAGVDACVVIIGAATWHGVMGGTLMGR